MKFVDKGKPPEAVRIELPGQVRQHMRLKVDDYPIYGHPDPTSLDPYTFWRLWDGNGRWLGVYNVRGAIPLYPRSNKWMRLALLAMAMVNMVVYLS
jgi:hypothetical protein